MTSPLRPLSETLLDFGTPILGTLGGASLDDVRAAMLGVITIWNAHVLAQPRHQRGEVLSVLEHRLRSAGNAELVSQFELLARRFAERFAHDPRLVGPWSLELTPDGRGLTLTAEVGLPPAPDPEPVLRHDASAPPASRKLDS